MLWVVLLGGALPQGACLSRLADFQVRRILSAEVRRIDDRGFELLVRCRVHNPNRWGATLSEIRFQAFVGAHRLGQGTVPGTRRIAARSTFTLAVPVRVAFRSLPPDFPRRVSGGVLPLRVRASFVAATAVGTLRLRPESLSRVPAGGQIAVLVRGSLRARETIRARLTRVRLGLTVALEFELRVRNRFPFPLRIRRATYRVLWGGQPVGTGALSRPWALAARATARRRFSLDVPAHAALRVAWTLRRRRAPEVRVQGTLWIDPIGGIGRIPFDVVVDERVVARLRGANRTKEPP